MKIAIVALGDGGGKTEVPLDIVSRIDTGKLPVPVVVLTGEKSPLKTLEIAGTYDGLIIVDRARMGEAPGTPKTFDLNDLVLGNPSGPVTLLSFKIDSELLFAHKYLGLPRTKIVCIEAGSSDETPGAQPSSRDMDHYQEVIRQAVDQLIRPA